MDEQTNQPPAGQSPLGGANAEREEHHKSSAEHKPSTPKSKWPFIVIGLLVLVLIPLGGYFVLNQSGRAPTPTATPTPTEEAGTETQATPTPTIAAMKNYTSKKLANISFSGYSLKHPEDWIATSERDDKVGTAKLTLTKDDYSITIQQGPMGGALCIYKDADLPAGFEGPTSDIRGKAYTDIKTSFGDIRRNEESGGIGENGFSFCQKNEEDGSYGSFTSVGAMGYSTPANPDEEILSEMDIIIKSIKTLP